MLSRDKRLPLDTTNTSAPQENVFGNQFSTVDSSRDHPQGIHRSTTPGTAGTIHKRLEQELLSQELKIKIGAQFQCRRLQEGRRS